MLMLIRDVRDVEADRIAFYWANLVSRTFILSHSTWPMTLFLHAGVYLYSFWHRIFSKKKHLLFMHSWILQPSLSFDTHIHSRLNFHIYIEMYKHMTSDCCSWVHNWLLLVLLQMNVGIPLYTFEHVGTISFVKANTVVQRRNDIKDVACCDGLWWSIVQNILLVL